MIDERFTIDGDRVTVVDNWVENVGEVYHCDGEYKGLYELKYSGEAEHLCKLLNKLNDDLEQFRNLSRDYNIPLDKLCETFDDLVAENNRLTNLIHAIDNDYEAAHGVSIANSEWFEGC